MIIPIFSSEFINRWWSEPCSIPMVHFSPSIQQQGKQAYNFEANNVGLVYNEKSLIRQAAKLCLGNG